VVDPETQFKLEIIADGLDEADIKALCEWLLMLDGGPSSAVGSGVGKGFGRIRLLPGTLAVTHASPASIVAWLGDQTTKPDQVFQPRGDLVAAVSAHANATSLSSLRTMPMSLQIGGYFLVSYAVDKGIPDNKDRASRAPIPIRQARKPETIAPRHAWLPGSSLKGALRAQAERIWRTMTGDLSPWPSEDDVPEVIRELFGATSHRGRLIVDDYLDREAKLVTHEMVAIDRFTGGAAEGKKYSVEAFEAPRLEGQLTIEWSRRKAFRQVAEGETPPSQPISNAALGLLALTLRDLAEGDIPLGYGTRKGYGDVTFARSGNHDVLERLAYMIRPELAQGEAFMPTIMEVVNALRAHVRAQQKDGGL
jgi:CRISPR/Cas system CSM-associated protein Csm3 (group 7 of RAMP superfamily)